MTVNLRQMAEDEVVFKFENDEDKREFWELYIENNGSKYSNRSLLDILMQDNSTNFKVFVYYNEIFYGYSNNSWKYPTWTEIKERYGMKNLQVDATTEKIMEAIESIKEFEREVKIKDSITLLQSLGYKVEAPYIPPTDEEIVERIKFENKKLNWNANWQNQTQMKAWIQFDHGYYEWTYRYTYCFEMVGLVYTNEKIAEQICAELNEKRFERVSEQCQMIYFMQ